MAVLAVLEFPAAAAAHLGVVGDLPHGHHLGHQVRRQDRGTVRPEDGSR